MSVSVCDGVGGGGCGLLAASSAQQTETDGKLPRAAQQTETSSKCLARRSPEAAIGDTAQSGW